MEGRIARYFPSVLKQAAEFQALAGTEDTELLRLWSETYKLLGAQFVYDADETGLRRWEKLLKLKGKGSLETRRAAILLKLNDKLPYTMRWLNNKLDVALAGKVHGAQIDGFLLTIYSDETGIEILRAMRRDIRLNIPANILLLWLIRVLPQSICAAAGIRPRLLVKTFYSVRHRYEPLALDGSWELDGKYRLDGMKTTVRQDYYPAGAGAKYLLNANASIAAWAVIDKDLWYLDGMEVLDGARILDAEVIRKEL